MNYGVACDWRKLISITRPQNMHWHHMKYWWKIFVRGKKNYAILCISNNQFSHHLIRKYQLRKVMVNGDIPPRVKKDAHAVILEFIRSRPPLRKVSVIFFISSILTSIVWLAIASVAYQFFNCFFSIFIL